MTPRRKKQLVKRRQAKNRPKRKETKLEYETRIKQEKGLQFMGYLKMPIDYVNFRDLADRSEYFGEWNPDMPDLQADTDRVYHVVLHLKPIVWAGGRTRNGFSGGSISKKLICRPLEMYREVKKLIQIVCIEHDVEVNELTSFAVIRS